MLHTIINQYASSPCARYDKLDGSTQHENSCFSSEPPGPLSRITMYITIMTSINAGMWRRCGPQYEKSEFWSVVSTGVMLVGEARETAQVQNTKQEKNDKRGWEGEGSEEMRAHMR